MKPPPGMSGFCLGLLIAGCSATPAAGPADLKTRRATIEIGTGKQVRVDGIKADWIRPRDVHPESITIQIRVA